MTPTGGGHHSMTPTRRRVVVIPASKRMDTLRDDVQGVAGSVAVIGAKMDEVLSATRWLVANGNHPGDGQYHASGAADPEGRQKRVQHADRTVPDRTVADYAQRLREAEAALAQSQTELRRLQEKESRFRNIILDRSGSQQLSDTDVIDAFVKLRQRAQRIFKKEYFGTMAVSRAMVSGYHKDHPARKFIQAIEGFPESKDRLLWARTKVFRLLYRHIFQVNTFGLVGRPLRGKHKEELAQQMEANLDRVERFMKDEDVPASAISDWRIETLKCLDHLPAVTRERPAAEPLGMLIDCLNPLILPSVTPDQCDTIKDDLARLCEEAWQLGMMMRRSKEEYGIWVPEMPLDGSRPRLSELSNEAESMAIEGPKGSEPSDDISFTLFGGLTKHPAYRGEGLCVLEKAHVVLRRK